MTVEAAAEADAPGADSVENKPYPSASAGWFLVIMLTIAYIFSFVDRYILGLLVEPIKAEFNLTDIQIGWLLSAFTFVYGFVGIFMGWLIDRGRRMWIVSIGVALWSAATVATGMAKNFVQLFIARMSVGVGEATLSPATFSMIGDSFPPEKRGKPIAFYSSALPIGAGVASLVSAGIIAWAASGGSQSLPFFGELSPWRFTLIVVGLPGILLALFFLFMKEPIRRPAPVSDDVVTGSGFLDALRYLFKEFCALCRRCADRLYDDGDRIQSGSATLHLRAHLGMERTEICADQRYCAADHRSDQHDDFWQPVRQNDG